MGFVIGGEFVDQTQPILASRGGLCFSNLKFVKVTKDEEEVKKMRKERKVDGGKGKSSKVKKTKRFSCRAVSVPFCSESCHFTKHQILPDDRSEDLRAYVVDK